jgi:hypothetical protein
LSNSPPLPDLSCLPSHADRRLAALRAATRAFPGAATIGDGAWSLGAEIGLPIRLHAFRAIFITWTEYVFGGVRPGARKEAFDALHLLLSKLDAALPDFWDRNFQGNDYAVGAAAARVEAARRAIALVEAIDLLEFRPLSVDLDHSHTTAFDTVSRAGPDGRKHMIRWRAAQQSAIAADCQALMSGDVTRRKLALAPLWSTPTCAALETNLTDGLSERDRKEMGRRINIWLRERKDGALVLGKDPEEVEECLTRTANLPASFWESRAAADTLYALDYCLGCDLDNPTWGSETMKRPAYLRS